MVADEDIIMTSYSVGVVDFGFVGEAALSIRQRELSCPSALYPWPRKDLGDAHGLSRAVVGDDAACTPPAVAPRTWRLPKLVH